MKTLFARSILPSSIAATLWGDSKQWGLTANEQKTMLPHLDVNLAIRFVNTK